MVQGLGFLSKKSWHTKNLANQERVFLAEQRKEEEERRTHELAKQIQQEREQEELAKIAGKSASIDRGVDWMYSHGQECAKEDALKEREEYLLGKAIGSSHVMKGDLAAAAEDQDGVNMVLAQQMKRQAEEQPDSKPPASYSEPSVAEKNEAFRMRMEDPMFSVMQRSREMERAAESKAKLYEKVTGKTAVLVAERDNCDDKRVRKDKKKRKSKHSKHSRHHRDHSSDSSDEGYRRSSKHRRKRSRSRSRSHSPMRDEKRHERQHSPMPVDSDRHRRRRSPIPAAFHRGDGHRMQHTSSVEANYRQEPRRRHHSPGSDYSRTKHRHEESYDTPHGHNNTDHQGFVSRGRTNNTDGSHDSANAATQHVDRVTYRRDGNERYGLQGSKERLRPSDLGPDADLLQRKRRDKEMATNVRPINSNRNVTDQEKAAALAAMQQDALTRRESAKDRPRTDGDGASESPRGRASFLDNIAREAHGVSERNL